MNPFLQRVSLRNYKSIEFCDVELPSLCFLVGRNGAGKSNFLDALRLVSDALNTSLDLALRDRGGISEVRRRSPGHPNNFGVRLDFRLPEGRCGHYSFRVGSQKKGGFEVQKEDCQIYDPRLPGMPEVHYSVEAGKVTSSSIPTPPAARSDRFYLVNVSGFDEFRPLYDSLSRMGFYNLNPDEIRSIQPLDDGLVLKHDGSNIACVLANMQLRAPEEKARVEEFLTKVVPGIKSVESQLALSTEILVFHQRTRGAQDPWRFLAANMSDGTLRALGVLVALFQGASMEGIPTPLIGIEEPESALHPGAAGVLLDALRAAAERTQVLVTTHSPDLLDDKDVEAGALLAVSNTEGVTTIAPVDETSRSVIREHLQTAGELLRINQLEPDPGQVRRQEATQRDLFEKGPQ